MKTVLNRRECIGTAGIAAIGAVAGMPSVSAAMASKRVKAKRKCLKVGAAYINITPNRPLANYNGDILKPDQVTVPLQAHIIICADGETKAAVISIDGTFIDRALILRIRNELRQRIGINPDSVLVAATHSHATPALCPSFLAGALPDPLYLDFLIDRVGQAAQKADKNITEAVLAAGVLPAPPIGCCRRRLSPTGQVFILPGGEPSPDWPPENIIDEQMQFLAFERIDGGTIAVIFNFPCHNNLTYDAFDGDMFARAGQLMRKHLGNEVATIALAAPSGDVGWFGPDRLPTLPGSSGDERAWAGATAITEPIIAAYKDKKRQRCYNLVVCSTTKRIRDRSYEDSHFCHDDCRGATERQRAITRRRYDPEEAAVKTRGRTSCDVEIQCIAFGDVAIVTNPAELFSVYGVKIKSESPFDVTLVSSLTNGYCGYVPTYEAFAHRGYETHRTVYTSRLEKKAGDIIKQLSVEMLRSAHNRLRK